MDISIVHNFMLYVREDATIHTISDTFLHSFIVILLQSKCSDYTLLNEDENYLELWIDGYEGQYRDLFEGNELVV